MGQSSNGTSLPYLYNLMKYRRTIRHFSNQEVEDEKLNRILQAGIYAPSGSNKSPFKIFVIKNPTLKKEIRFQAENIEREFYLNERKIPDIEISEWILRGDIRVVKKFLTEAPILLIVVEDSTYKDLHSNESTWLTIAYLILSIANEGLATVTYTPEPHHFMNEILGLPSHFLPQVILPIGCAIDQRKRSEKRPNIEERVIFMD